MNDGHGHDGWIVPKRGLIPHKRRLHLQRMITYDLMESAALIADGEMVRAKTYFQGAQSKHGWLNDEHDD